MIDQKEAGCIALLILQYKVKKNGLNLQVNEFNQLLESRARSLKFPKQMIKSFYEKFLLPQALRANGLIQEASLTPPTNNLEDKIAIALAQHECFHYTVRIGEEVQRIHAAQSPHLSLDKIKSFAHYVISQRLKNEFGAHFIAEEFAL